MAVDRQSALDRRRDQWLAVSLLAALTVVHTALAVRFPLAPDETYYWEWSRHLDWGYYDQGPFIAWLIRASTALLGSTELGVRAGIIACAALTRWLIYRTGALLFGSRAGLIAMICSAVTPMGLAGGFVATYDVPLVLFWSWSLYLLARATMAGSEARNGTWLVLGIVAGLGMLSKYTMALLLPCAVLYLAVDRSGWHWLRRPEPYVAMLIAVLVFLPNVFWQSRHEWVTFAHVLGLTEKGQGGHPLKQFGDFVGSQLGLVTPLLAFGMFAALVSGWQNRSREDASGHWFGFCMGVPVLVVFLLLALKTKVQANWAVTGWVGATLTYAGWVAEGGRRRTAYAWAAVGLAVCVSLLIAWPELRTVVGLRVPARWDQSRKMYGGHELAAACAPELQRLARQSGSVVAGAATYDNASRLAFYLPGQPRVHCFFLGTRDNQYRYLNAASGLRRGSYALIVDHRAPDDPLLPPFQTVFERVEPVPAPVVVRMPRIYDEPVVTYYLYRCYGYRGDESRLP